ncbi:Uncharacterized protein PECH_003308 [Penicillium ucsense]|uniref:Uncharacterized protein n=1 Tax=Penicillium ucsense TaxID=2839758 RepID=A0A8J8VW38_9EURO|nr:Uncharacterized protein PECM_002946 [Penicillium ucsense]KAF7729581.1 Uncharacterized protein PECH_003308 [Penicillium ucsense]
MAPTLSLIKILSLVLAYLSPLVLSAPWIVTDHYQQVQATERVYDYSKQAYILSTQTTYEEIVPTATPLPEAIQTNTIVKTESYYGDTVTFVNELYPSGAAGTPPGNTVNYYGNQNPATSVSTIWVVNMTYSAPTACSTQWTTTTAVPITLPYNYGHTLENLLPTTAASTSYNVVNDGAFTSTTSVYEFIWVDPTQVPSATLSSLSRSNYPRTLYDSNDYSCAYQGYSGSSYSGNYDYGDYGSPWGGLTWWAIIVIGILGWAGLFFICGIIEAWFRFRRLMNGWQTRRGLPVCWALMIIPLTCLCLFCFRRGYRSRNAHDAAVLQARWKRLGAWKKFTLFLKWGFRYRYPTILGPAPERVTPSKRPGKHPGAAMGPPLLDSTASQEDVNGPLTPARSLDQRAASDVSGPEMSQVRPSEQHVSQPARSTQADDLEGAEHSAEPQRPQSATTSLPANDQEHNHPGPHDAGIGRAQ